MNLDKRMEFIDYVHQLKHFDEMDKVDIILESSTYYKKLSNKLFRRFLSEKYKKKSYLYLTLSPDKLLRNIECTEDNLKAMDRWANQWFKYNKKHYGEDWAYVVEVGSNGDHPHIHALVELKNSHKHALQLKNSWKKTFPNNQLLTSKNLGIKDNKRGEYAYLRIDDEKILNDKINYLIEERKGTHQNLYSTNLGGSGGSLNDKLKDP